MAVGQYKSGPLLDSNLCGWSEPPAACLLQSKMPTKELMKQV